MEDTDTAQVAPEEERLRTDAHRFRVVAIIAGVLFALMVLPQALMPLSVLPTFAKMFSDMGGELPGPTAAMVALGPWFSIVLLAADALIFWLFYSLARKYWIGLLFAPFIAVNIVTALFVWAMYMPMFNGITLVK